MHPRAVMQPWLLATALTSVTLLASMAVWAAPSAADLWTPVDCDENPDQPGCDVTAETPEQPGWRETSTGEVVCVWEDEEMPCTDDWGWFGGDGCYYRRAEEGPSERDGAPGAQYVPRCIGDPPNSVRPAVWIPDSEVPGPGLLAQIAVSRLSLPAPQIELSPPGPQLVRLPVWLWVEESTWGSRSATASVPGLSVTATATPTRVVWSTGDGESLTCMGPGTAWRPELDPRAESPTCGHTYTRTSRGEPGGAFELSATVTWTITWSGGGVSGSVDPMTTSAGIEVVVTESLSHNTGGQP